MPKYVFGKPSDVFAHTGPALPAWLEERVLGFLMNRVLVRDLTRYGLPAPDHPILRSHPIMNTQVLHHLRHGDLEARPDVRALRWHEVEFTDGSTEEIDLIVWATGYERVYPFLAAEDLDLREGALDFYLNVFHRRYPDLSVHRAFDALMEELGEVDRETGKFRSLRQDFDFYEQIVALDEAVAVVAANPARAKHVRLFHADGSTEILQAADSLPADAALSRPESISWVTGDGRNAHGLFYAPASEIYGAPEDERPPVIIKCHGGPTGATNTALDARIQYWTSRGYAVLDVNYRGSTGYGRAYRQALVGAWGIADVEDCEYGAAHLAAADRIDPERVLISGSSAGGYTVLSVLTFTDLAAAGASYYGIGDLKRLLASTHKFESRYLDRLIGTETATLEARSPLYHAEQLSCPVLFLQGMRDKVVPPDQAESMVAALRESGVPVAYVAFDSERHGFKDADNIMTAIEAERTFYTRVLGIREVDDLEALTIENFDEDSVG
mgnify:CR=1 FL=1